MRRLIVNGDDMGRTRNVTRGIIEAYRHGILTSASLVASGIDFDFAVAMAQEYPGLGVGVHLVLDEHDSLLDPSEIPNLVTPQGAFWSRPVCLLKIQLGLIRPEEVAREWEAQIQKVVDAGIEPTHLDGHGHVHASPRLAQVVAELASKFGIPAVRLPAEPLSYTGKAARLPVRRYIEKSMLYFACRSVRRQWAGRLVHPDPCYGFMDGGQLNPEALEAVVNRLKSGVAELIAHPGIENNDEPYGVANNWRGDLDTLLRFTKAEFQKSFDVELTSYRNAWSHP